MPKQGVKTHEHQDMEIISYVLSGKLEHMDSIDNISIKFVLEIFKECRRGLQ